MKIVDSPEHTSGGGKLLRAHMSLHPQGGVKHNQK